MLSRGELYAFAARIYLDEFLHKADTRPALQHNIQRKGK